MIVIGFATKTLKAILHPVIYIRTHSARFWLVLPLLDKGTLSRSSLTSSPEFTTNGMLAKCRRRQEGKIVLYKSGTAGFSNAGKEPYSEFYTYQIAQAAGFDAVAYGLAKWKNYLCSTCELFTSLDISYVPAGKIVKTGGIEKVIEYCQGLGDGYINKLSDMFFLITLS